MGNESSQLEKHADTANRGGRVIGPPMSPTPSDDEQGRVFGPAMSPLPGEDEADLREPASPKDRPKSPSKKKRKKQRESFDSAHASQEARSAYAAGEADEEEVVEALPNKKGKRKPQKKLSEPEAAGDVVAMNIQPEAAFDGVDESHQSPKRKSKKRAKKNRINDRLEEDTTQGDGLINADALHGNGDILHKNAARAENKSINGDTDITSLSTNALRLVSHALEGSPPSAQQPPLNGILQYESDLGHGTDEQVISPSNQLTWRRRPSMHSQANAIEPRQLKIEAPGNSDDGELQLRFAGIAATSFADAFRDPKAESMREDDPQPGLSWLHKDGLEAANMPIIDTRAGREGHSNEASPDLLPSQIKTELESDSNFDSESDSPSAARLERLSGSRSRSASKASTSQAVWMVDHDLGLSRTARPPPGPTLNRTYHSSFDDVISSYDPSTPGSNASIPARIEAANSEPMDVDSPAESDKQSSPKKRATRANLPSKKAAQPTRGDADVADKDTPVAGAQAKRTRKQLRRRQNDGVISSRDVHVMTNQLRRLDSGVQPAQTEADQNITPENDISADDMPIVDNNIELDGSPRQLKSARKRKAKPSLVSEIENTDSLAAPRPEVEVVAENGQTAAVKPQNKARKKTAHDNNGLRDDSIESREPVNQPSLQPKGKKKRKLQQNASLSLTQIEGEDETMEGPSRLSAFEIGASQEPIPASKPRKTKRKRRTGSDASEDEMESLLAAGPSKSRKRASKIGLNDDDVRAENRKRLQSNGEKATGAWTSEELSTLGRVVEEFRDANSMTQQEMNQMIHEVPSKKDSVNQDFWNRADIAIPARTRKQITERARRLYHNFVARGTWTEEQKQELHELLGQHGEKPSYPWAEIAAAINRDQKDVRDYWRNHYLVHENQVKSRWSKEDEEGLRQAVEEALNKIRIMRENNDQLRPHPRSKKFDEEALLDWQQISKTMGLTRSRQQCRWKWNDMREKGLVGDASIILPTQPRSSAGAGANAGGSGRLINGISEELANAREDYRGMSDEEMFRLVDAIHDSNALTDGRIKWSRLVDKQFRAKWKRPTLKLVWYRLRRTVPDYEHQDLDDNTQFLINYYNQHQMLPRIGDNQVDELAEENLVRYAPGKRVWKQLSDNSRALRERQRRSSSVGTHASNWSRRKISTEVLRIDSSDGDEQDSSSPAQGGGGSDENGQRRRRRRRTSLEDVPIMIPKHLKGEAAKKALEAARAKASGKGKGKEPARASRSASVAIDSDSE